MGRENEYGSNENGRPHDTGHGRSRVTADIQRQFANTEPRLPTRFGMVPPMNVLVALVVVALFQVVAAVAFGSFAFSIEVERLSLGEEQWILSPAYLVSAAVVMLAFSRNMPRPLARFLVPSGESLALSLAAGLVFCAILSGFFVLAGTLNLHTEIARLPLSEVLRPVAPGSFGSVVAMMIVVPAVTEEAVLRGIVQPGLTARYSGVVGVTVTALLYAVGFGSTPRIVFGVFVAVTAGIFVHRARSIWPAFAVHIVANAASVWALGGRLDTVLDQRGVFLVPILALPAGLLITRAVTHPPRRAAE